MSQLLKRRFWLHTGLGIFCLFCFMLFVRQTTAFAKPAAGFYLRNIAQALPNVPTSVPTIPTPVPTAPTPEPTATNTPVATATNTPVATATNTPVATATNTPVATATNTPVATATPTTIPTATATPAQTIQLSVGLSGGKVSLSWVDGYATFAHQIHRSTTPFFTATGGNVYTLVAAGVNSFEDTNSQTGNYFYIVTATNGNIIATSPEVGKVDYALKNSSGDYSMVGIPFLNPSPSDAAGLATQIGNVSNIYHWDANTQSFQVFTPPNIDNFTLTYGEAVFVQVGSGAPAKVAITGHVVRNSISLHPNNYSFIALPLQCNEVTDASDAASDITHVTNLLKWDLTFQSFQTFTPPNFGDDFSLQIGSPFIVQLDASGPASWPNNLTSVCQ